MTSQDFIKCLLNQSLWWKCPIFGKHLFSVNTSTLSLITGLISQTECAVRIHVRLLHDLKFYQCLQQKCADVAAATCGSVSVQGHNDSFDDIVLKKMWIFINSFIKTYHTPFCLRFYCYQVNKIVIIPLWSILSFQLL